MKWRNLRGYSTFQTEGLIILRTGLFTLSGVLIACATVANILSVQQEQVSEFMGLQALVNVFSIIIFYSAVRNTSGQSQGFSNLVQVRYKIVIFQLVCLSIAYFALDVNPLVFAGAIVILTSEIFSPCHYYIVNHRHAELTREQIFRAVLLLGNAAIIYFWFKPVSAGYILLSNGLLTFLSYAVSLWYEKIPLRMRSSSHPDSLAMPLSVWSVLRENALVFLFRFFDMFTIWAVHLQVVMAAAGDLVQYRLQTMTVSLMCQIFVLRRIKQSFDVKVLWISVLVITVSSLASFVAIQHAGQLILMDFPKLSDKCMTLLLGVIAWVNTLGFMLAPHIHKMSHNPKHPT